MTPNDPKNTLLTRVPLLATGYTPAAGDVSDALAFGGIATARHQVAPNGSPVVLP